MPGHVDRQSALTLSDGTPVDATHGLPSTLANTLDNINDSIDVPLHTVRFVGNVGVTASSAYAAGQLLGAVQVFTPVVRNAGLGAIVDTVTLYDNSKQNAAIDVLFFNTATSSTTFTDKAAIAIAGVDLTTLAGHVSVLSTNYCSFNANSIATVSGVGLRLKPIPGTIVYVALVSRGTPAYANTADLSVAISCRQD
jgi:hypothetical protein